MTSREITLWIDERWYHALNKELKNETLEEHLEDVIDQLCNNLPEQIYNRISREVFEECMANRQAVEASKRYTALHITEDGDQAFLKTDSGVELLQVASTLRNYIRRETGSKPFRFAEAVHRSILITAEEYENLTKQRMENTGKIIGVFDINFDRQEFSAVHIMDGWKTYALQDVSTAAYHAMRKQGISTGERWTLLLGKLDGKEIASPGHLSAQDINFSDEIIESDGKLNFYIDVSFDVDKMFGTHVLTDENDDWLNIYANYDIAHREVCDTLELTLCKGDGNEDEISYTLNAAEKEALRSKMEDYCEQAEGATLDEFCARMLAEEDEPIMGQQM